jgi:hypothetical protein
MQSHEFPVSPRSQGWPPEGLKIVGLPNFLFNQLTGGHIMNVSRVSKPLRACLVGIVAALAGGSMSTALAARSVRVDLVPMAETGNLVAQCDGFQVLNDYIFQGHVIEHFDKNGIE